jgi:hypothetical protein
MELPPGYVWRLIKSLYGLVQAPRAWYDTLTAKLIQLGFRVSPFDPCVYISTTKLLIISVHVDDIRMYAATDGIIEAFRQKLSEAFTITSEDPDALYLGMHIEQTQNTIKIHQQGYVKRRTDRFGYNNLPPAKTPCDHRIKLQREETATASKELRKSYLQKFGSLNYLPAMTRIDLAYAASLYGRFNANPAQTHLDGITRAYAYANATQDTGITYTKQVPKLVGYCDSDWAGCPDTRRSTSGYIFTLAGGPISWASSIQKVVALSTCEAEYIALSEAVKEGLWIKNFINDLDVGIHFDKIPIHVDNESAIKLAKNPEFHQRSKHIDIRHHFIRDNVRDGTIEVTWMSGKENPADMLTKPLDPIKFTTICDSLRLTNVNNTDSIAMTATSLFDAESILWNENDETHYLDLKEEQAAQYLILEQEWLANTYGITTECEEAWHEYHDEDITTEQDSDLCFHHEVYGRQLPDYDSDTEYSLHGTQL